MDVGVNDQSVDHGESVPLKVGFLLAVESDRLKG
jgi:hypothetical protein